MTLEEIEAEYCGVSVECLRSIQQGDQWGQRITTYRDCYHSIEKWGERPQKKKAKRLRGNKYVKLRGVGVFG
tara:strand:+ start:446 stop:661 length:216 start_codon:yes stop_codon:yes gene_type:complete